MHPQHNFVYSIIKGKGSYICVQSQAEDYYRKRCYDTENDGPICYTADLYTYDFSSEQRRSITEAQLQQLNLTEPTLDGFGIKVSVAGTYFNPVAGVYLTKMGITKELHVKPESEDECFLFLGWIK